MTFSDILDKKQFIVFGGKGGTGKTTCAVATGIHLAMQRKKVLIVSVDPAHSLSKIFEQDIGNTIVGIDTIEGLFALEVNTKYQLDEMKNHYRSTIEHALDQHLQGIDLPFDREVLQDFIDLFPPGLEDFLAISKLAEVVKHNSYDTIIIDTAAGTHGVRFMELTGLMNDWVKKALGMRRELRSGMIPVRGFLDALERMKKGIEMIGSLFKNPEKTIFVIVTIPEEMGTRVTRNMSKGLGIIGIPSNVIIVNNCISSDTTCDFCLSRSEEQDNQIKVLKNEFPEHVIVRVPLLKENVSGIESLTRFGHLLFRTLPSTELQHAQTGTEKSGFSPDWLKSPKLEFGKDVRLILFGGKGGTGKTTCSAACGIFMANQGRKTLVVSTDPQRSLSDIFDTELKEGPAAVEGIKNLHLLEIDSEKLLQNFKVQHGQTILDIVADATYLDKKRLTEFLDLSLPGMDEAMALLKLMELVEKHDYDIIILDTAPTGHTLRLLDLPNSLSNWMRALVKMRAKQQYLAQKFFGQRLRETADIFLDTVLESIGKLNQILKGDATQFVVVTSLDRIALEESERLVLSIQARGMTVSQIVCNGIVPPNPSCVTCNSKNTAQESILHINERFPQKMTVMVPLFPYAITGIKKLSLFSKALFEK